MDFENIGIGNTRAREYNLLQEGDSDYLFKYPNYYDDVVSRGYLEGTCAAESVDKNGPFVVQVRSSPKHYMKTRDIRVKIEASLYEGGTANKPSDKVRDITCTPFLTSTLFSMVETDIANLPLTEGNQNLYWLKGYIEELSSNPKSASRSGLASDLGFLDKPRSYQDTKLWKDFKSRNEATRKQMRDTKNQEPMWKRSSFISPIDDETGDIFNIEGRLHCDHFQGGKPLLPGLDLTFTFHLNPSKLYLITAEDPVVDFYIQILSISVYVPTIQYTDSILLRDARTWSSKPLVYPYQKTVPRTRQYTAGIDLLEWYNVCLGILPKQLVIVMIKTANFHGDAKTSPVMFDNCDARDVSITINNQDYPEKSIVTDFKKNNIWEGYHAFLSLCNYKHGERGTMVTADMFKEDYTMWCFDLTSDKCSGWHLHRPLTGAIDLKMKLGTALPAAYTMVVMCIYEKAMLISYDKSVAFQDI